jgi:hypothetical protein
VLLRVEVEFASDRRQRVGDDDDIEESKKKPAAATITIKSIARLTGVRSIAPPMISALSARFSGMALSPSYSIRAEAKTGPGPPDTGGDARQSVLYGGTRTEPERLPHRVAVEHPGDERSL